MQIYLKLIRKKSISKCWHKTATVTSDTSFVQWCFVHFNHTGHLFPVNHLTFEKCLEYCTSWLTECTLWWLVVQKTIMMDVLNCFGRDTTVLNDYYCWKDIKIHHSRLDHWLTSLLFHIPFIPLRQLRVISHRPGTEDGFLIQVLLDNLKIESYT